MSWSVSVPDTEPAKFEAALAAVKLAESYKYAVPESQKELDAAKEAIRAMLKAGALGPLEGFLVSCSMGGHAQDRRDPQEASAWSNTEFVTLNLTKRPKPQPEPAEPPQRRHAASVA